MRAVDWFVMCTWWGEPVQSAARLFGGDQQRPACTGTCALGSQGSPAWVPKHCELCARTESLSSACRHLVRCEPPNARLYVFDGAVIKKDSSDDSKVGARPALPRPCRLASPARAAASGHL